MRHFFGTVFFPFENDEILLKKTYILSPINHVPLKKSPRKIIIGCKFQQFQVQDEQVIWIYFRFLIRSNAN